ncbi:MAG: hypothetical protein GKS01_14070 [Alphaproteobacteria bacterium]|nr:hypothetical protein [Alphaproteobacteria bacterium]
MTIKRLFIAGLCCVLLPIATTAAMTITVTNAYISGDFSTFSVTSDISGFTNSGDISHFTAIAGLQNLANQEEAIGFALATSFPSAGQSIPDHVPSPPPPGGRTINPVSVIVDLTLNTFSVTGVLQGDWNFTAATDYTFILGLQNSANQEEGIVFSNDVQVSAPTTLGPFAMALVFMSYYRRRQIPRLI